MVKLTTLPLHLARSLHQQTSTVCITADATWWPRETLELVLNPKEQSSFFLQVQIHLINPGRPSQNRPNGSMLLWGHSVEVKSWDFGGPIQGTQVDSSHAIAVEIFQCEQKRWVKWPANRQHAPQSWCAGVPKIAVEKYKIASFKRPNENSHKHCADV